MAEEVKPVRTDRIRGRFKPGVSGNPKGRTKGSKDWRSQHKAFLQEELPHLLKTVIEQAKSGDMQAMKLVLDRILPALKPEPRDIQNFALPDGTVKDQVSAIAGGIIDGRVPNEVGATIGGMLLRAEQQQAETGPSYEDELKRLIGQDETQESD